MGLEHVAIWTDDLEALKDYYVKYFDGTSNSKYTNESNQFNSYFITFQSGARLEIMSMPDIPDNTNDRVVKQHKGIIHLAFGVDTIAEVDKKAKQFQEDGFTILSGQERPVMDITNLKHWIRIITGWKLPAFTRKKIDLLVNVKEYTFVLLIGRSKRRRK